MLSAFDLLIIVIALIIIFTGFLGRRSAWRAGLKEKRAGDFAGLLKYLFGHSKIMTKRAAGIAHLVIFWGFLIPLIVIILAQSDFKIPLVPAEILSLLMDILGIAFLAGTVFFLIRRIKSEDPLSPKRSIFPMILLCIVLITGFLAEGARLSIIPDSSWASPFGWLLSMGLPPSPVFMQIMIRLHFFAVFIFIAILPFTFVRHLVTSPINVFYKRKNSRGELKKAYIDKGQIGANTVRDFTWKQLLDSEACVSCGRCDENCPAAVSGKPLKPRKIIQDILQLMLSGSKNRKRSLPDSPLDSKITGDEIWSCTACMACVEHCPVFIEPMDRIIEMRRYQVMGKGLLPAEAVPMIRNLELYGDVQGMGISHRRDWAMNRDVPLFGRDFDFLLWAGCSGAFHPRYQEVARSLVKILNAAGVRFGILGKDELCCGDPARRLGEESLFLKIAGINIQTFRNYNVKKIITMCPHCYNTLKNEYPGIDEKSAGNAMKDIEVVHAVEFAMDLIKEKRIIPKYPVNKHVAVHDPCYLGRVNGIYEQPRSIIKNLPGTNLTEFKRNYEKGFCCGGGGGGMWLHEHLGKRLNAIRAEEAAESGADIIGTACPYCLTMLDDGISGLDLSKPPKVLDIIEILASSIG